MTAGEIDLVRSVFGDAIDCAKVRIRRRKWFPFQPRRITMAPLGHLHFHPESTAYCHDFSRESFALQGFFIHEMTHVWQHQQGLFLPLRRMPWSRYEYEFQPAKPLTRYGIEQQAEIVRHAFLLERGVSVAGAPELDALRAILPFRPMKQGSQPHAA